MFKLLRKMILFAYLMLLVLPPPLRAQQTEDFDQYKLRVDAFWFYSANPSGTLQEAWYEPSDIPVLALIVKGSPSRHRPTS
jgi:hypothetical protein